MDFNATIDLIIRELEEVREIMDDLKKFPDAPALEIELAKSKLRNAGEVIAFLKQRSENPVPPKKEEPLPEKKTEKPRYQPEIKNAVPEKKHDHEKRPEKTKTGGERNNETLEIDSDEEKDPGKPEIESTGQKPFVAPIIADTFSHLANRFNEQIGEKQTDDISYTRGKPYTNLSDAIGINDRFYYIRELFDGNRDAYNEAISRLEKAENMNEAKEIVLSYRKGKQDIPATKQLLDLVKRKFTSHE
jgi:hypothetical protein